MRKPYLIIIYFFLIFIFTTFYFSLNNKKIYDTESMIGKKINEVELTLFNNDKFNINKISNYKYTLINFWASWCAPCRDEHPILLKLSNEENLKLLGVNFKDKKNNAIEFLNKLGDPYDDLTKDEFGKHSINFGIYGIPESILIDKDLIIIKKFIGPMSKNDYNYIKDIVGSNENKNNNFFYYTKF